MSNIITIKTTNSNYGFSGNTDTIDNNNIPTNLELGELAVSGLPDIVTGDKTTLWLGMGKGLGAVPLAGHYNNIVNLSNISLVDLGIIATATELNYVDGVTSNIQTQLNNKMGDYSILIYNGTAGNPKPVRFASFNYSTCNSENGIAAKIGMVSGHGNGTSYAFLQDVIIRVNHNGEVEVDNLKYYGAAVADSGVQRQYGDIFWLIDSTNKIVDFYCLMGQYARLYQTPWKRLTYSTGGTVTQHTTTTVYSSGTKNWGNNSNIATMSAVQSYIETTLVNGRW